MSRTLAVLVAAASLAVAAKGQALSPPNVSQVLMYSGTTPLLPVTAKDGSKFSLTNVVPTVFVQAAQGAGLDKTVSSNYSASLNLAEFSSSLNASIATALSIVPLSSPASGWIVRKDPATGAELPVSGTLGPIFTERAETIGRGHFYVGVSNQDFHFTKYNGTSLNALKILFTGGSSTIPNGSGQTFPIAPATFNIGMDVRLSQNIAFLTYGVTDRLDVSLGLPLVHSAVAASTYNGTIYAGNGLGTFGSTCWCVSTFTPAVANASLGWINKASLGKTGLGDLLLRVKGTVVRKPSAVIAVGGDVRFPTGDAQNYLGVGTTTVKPFAAVSFYSKPLSSGIVLSPHFDVGWQFSGKSVLGGQLVPSSLSVQTTNSSGASETVQYQGAPFSMSAKGYLPDVFTWAGGAEVALGSHNTLTADFLGNQVGWIHGIPNAVMLTLPNQLQPTASYPDATVKPTPATVTGLVNTPHPVSFGQYAASFGDKVRIAGNLVAYVNFLIRLDHNGLTAGVAPMFGLGYSF